MSKIAKLKHQIKSVVSLSYALDNHSFRVEVSEEYQKEYESISNQKKNKKCRTKNTKVVEQLV